jgi:beta-N-acetylhexosaminidase
MVMVWVLGDYTSYTDSTFAEVRRWIERDHIGGVSMSLGTPIEVAAKINNMQRLSRVPLLTSADLEPGLGRLEGGVFTHYLLEAGSATVFPSAMAIAATGRDQDAYDAARVIAEEARAVGIQINFSPVVDVNNNPSNPVINTRSFGEDPQRVARLSAQFVRGTQDGGAISTAKHFPGHGDTDVDSHVGLPVVGANWSRLTTVELVPFRAAIEAGAAMVMTAHIALPAVEGDSTTPATLAPRIITGVLRDTLKFRGVAITDAMTMEGVGKGYSVEESSVLAVKAGADIILKPSDPTKAIDAVVAAVDRGEISRARIDSAARRVLELKARTGVAFNRLVDLDALREVVGSREHRAVADDIARRAVTLLRDTRAQLPLAGSRVAVVQYMPETELRAGKIFGNEIRAAFPGSIVTRISPATSATDLDSVARQVAGADRVVVAAYVRRIEGEGRPAVPPHIAKWIDDLAKKGEGRGRRAREPVSDPAISERLDLPRHVRCRRCARARGGRRRARSRARRRHGAGVVARVLQSRRWHQARGRAYRVRRWPDPSPRAACCGCWPRGAATSRNEPPAPAPSDQLLLPATSTSTQLPACSSRSRVPGSLRREQHLAYRLSRLEGSVCIGAWASGTARSM